MQKHIILGTSLTLLAALITGCEINEDVNPNLNYVPQTTQVTITPSLGKILNAKVVLKNAKTNAVLGSGETGNSGVAKFTAQKTPDPVVVEVMGQDGAKYFDESKGAEVDFGTGKQIRAALPMLDDNIGVSTLTEVAYQAALNKAGSSSALTSDIIGGANEAIRKALAPELSSITITPHLIGSASDLAMIANDDAGKYALKLAALAKLVSDTDATPALTLLNQLAADLEDGEFDGATTQEITLAYTNANLASKISTNLNNIITEANLASANFNVSQFNPVFGAITITIGSGGTGSGCVASVSGVPVIGTYKVCYKNFPQNAICGAGNPALSGISSIQVPGLSGNISWTFGAGSCEGALVTLDFAGGSVAAAVEQK
jgi:hypothetical protein